MFLGIIIVVLFVLFAFTCYKKAPPTAAIVVTGFGLKIRHPCAAACR